MIELKYWFDDRYEPFYYEPDKGEVVKVISKEIVNEVDCKISEKQVAAVLTLLDNRCDIDISEIAQSYEDELLEEFEYQARVEWDDMMSDKHRY